MKRLISILIIFILTLGFIPVDKAYGETIDYYIDVKLTRPLVQNDYVNLTSTNGFIIYDKEDKENPLFSIEDTSIKAMPNNGHIDLMDSANNILYSLPSDGSLIIGPNNLEEPIITVEKDSYRGYIRLFINDGELIVINHVYLEDYLYGVVPREMS